jgi:hypothetical protein
VDMEISVHYAATRGLVDQQIQNRFIGSLMTACMDLLISILLLTLHHRAPSSVMLLLSCVDSFTREVLYN